VTSFIVGPLKVIDVPAGVGVCIGAPGISVSGGRFTASMLNMFTTLLSVATVSDRRALPLGFNESVPRPSISRYTAQFIYPLAHVEILPASLNLLVAPGDDVISPPICLIYLNSMAASCSRVIGLSGANVVEFMPSTMPFACAQATGVEKNIPDGTSLKRCAGVTFGLPAIRHKNAANWPRVTLLSGSNVVGVVPVVTPLIHAHETYSWYH
jgi:hypothetical protein